ncbi:MAG: peptidoglycan DD-metalloendopeptidase family protein [Cyanobium sp. M30B3]|nr:MAG: peptidoglycan DD-metalloendopeptidase family protein [Cyanobium sp. M30B3]
MRGAPLLVATSLLAALPGLAGLETIEQPQAPVALPPPPPVQEAVPLRPAPAASQPQAQPQPLSPQAQPQLARPAQPIAPQPLRFDQSLDELVRQGVVSPAERQRIRTGATATPQQSPAHQRACSSGALSEQECSSGVVVRWRGRNDSQGPALQRPGDPELPLPSASELAAIGFSEGGPQPLSTPLTVPVSALMAGADGNFSLSSVFAITPRPSPVAGNGNRRLLFPLIGPAAISSGFGFRLHPVLGSWLMHAGKDFAAPEGTPVVAALGGRVVSSGMAGGYGLTVEVEHDNPRRRTLYAHLSELFVKAGDRVRQGEAIGRVGSTGMSTGPHLHFELRLPQDGGWVAVDPGDLDPGPAGIGVGNDAVALLMGQLLQRLERPQVQAQAPFIPGTAAGPVSAPRD